jgi:Leucine-rich repeat (LRR) protein
MKADPEFKPLLEKWGSEKAVYAFLKKEFDRINRAAFGGSLEMPTLKINPMEPNSTCNYAPAERHRPAVIGIFTNVLMDEDAARRVLAHYVIHHLENTLATDWDSEDYPASVDEEISKGFETGYRERAWRSAHSRRFISKACDVAKSGLDFLYLHDNRLTSLPPSLERLTKLRYLNISSNGFVALPECICGIAGLIELRACDNQLTSLPESLGRLSRLRELHVRNNRLISLPQSIDTLLELRQLDLRGNPLTDLPTALAALPRLKNWICAG